MMKTIKITSIILLVLVILSYAGYRYLNWSFNQPCDPPPKPDGMPINAKWYGGCDGGYWLEFVSYRPEDERYRFRIYLDYKTDILLDADYVLTKGCSQIESSYPTDSSIIDRIGRIESYYKKLYFKDISGNTCFLTPVYPAYGGIDWETLKETGEYKETQQ